MKRNKSEKRFEERLLDPTITTFSEIFQSMYCFDIAHAISVYVRLWLFSRYVWDDIVCY